MNEFSWWSLVLGIGVAFVVIFLLVDFIKWLKSDLGKKTLKDVEKDYEQEARRRGLL